MINQKPQHGQGYWRKCQTQLAIQGTDLISNCRVTSVAHSVVDDKLALLSLVRDF